MSWWQSSFLRLTERLAPRPRRNSTRRKRRPNAVQLSLEVLENRDLMSTGGGFTSSGLRGDYFLTNDLSGNPAFSRSDVRVDFGGAGSWGGSIAAGYAALPSTNFSVRWTGQILAQFSETYTFSTTAADGARLYVKDPATSTWTLVIDNWPAGGQPTTTASGTFTFQAGKAYDVKLEYHDLTHAPIARLAWSSPSTPQEVIDPATNLGFNVGSAFDYSTDLKFADAIKEARPYWGTLADVDTPAPADPNGWPLTDAQLVVWEGIGGDGILNGTYTLSFNGKADISIFGGPDIVGTPTYNAATNTTTATLFNNTPSFQNFFLSLLNTRRTATSPLNSGVTNVKLMRPTSPGATTSLDPSVVFLPAYENALKQFATLRFMAGTNSNQSVNWSDRTSPAYFTQFGPAVPNEISEGHGMSWEYRIMLANETGKDLYINIPEMATGSSPADTSSYIYQLAQLIKNGDTVNGVTYPGLNPNLKVYVEYSNEVWNFSFDQWRQNYNAAQAAAANHTADGLIINYDGVNDENVLWNRRQALRTKQTSDIFRAVFGDAAMGSRIRILAEFQYDNAGFPATADTQLSFLNNYFNNGDGQQHVTNPHPVSYYVWGAGGAVYFDGNNPDGYQTAIVLANNGFESPAVSGFRANPTGASWTFTGTAGVVHNGSTLGNPAAPQGTQAAYIEGKNGVNGSITQSVNFSAIGIYAIQAQATEANGSHIPIDVYLDSTWLGTFDVDPSGFFTYNSKVITITTPGTHTIKFVGTSTSGDNFAFLDDVRITNLDAIYNGGLPGQVAGGDYQTVLNGEVSWAKLYGLHDVAYEGGWALGSDGGGAPLQNYGKFNDPRTKQTQVASINDFYQAGGDLYVFGTYSQWDNLFNQANEPLPQGIVDRSNALPASPTNGVAVPATITPANHNLDFNGNSGQLDTNGWINWNILTPSTGTYRFQVSAGLGGTMQVAVDDAVLGTAASNSGGSFTAVLTRGLHTVRVKATAGSFQVNSVAVSSVTGTPPAAPSGLTAAAGNAQVTLSWTAPTGTVSGYNVYRSTTVGGEGSTPVNSGLITATTYTNTGLTNGTTYYYVVRAVNSAGSSGPSNEVSATPQAPITPPAAPTGLIATAGNAQVTLSWTAPTGTITGYNVYRGTTVGGEGSTPVNSGLITATSYTNTGLTNGTTYYYVVRAVNSAGSSSASNEALATPQAPITPPAAPTGLTATAGNAQVTLSWTAPSGTVTGYNVYRGIMAGGESSTPVNSSLLTAASYTDAGLSNGTTYYYVVRAVNSAGSGNPSSEVSAKPQAPITPPAAPTGLTATAGNALVVLSWTAPAGTIAGYNLYRGTTAGGESSTPVNSSLITTMNYTDTGLTNGITYYYVVRAVNSAGTSSPSNEVSAKPQVAFTGAHINFSNNATQLPTGYVADVGQAFGNRGNGLTYGWNTNNTTNGVDRDSSRSPSELYDSFIFMQRSPDPNASWQIAVPNGTYTVHLAAGDPSAINSVYKINVNGVLAINGTPTSTNRWIENTVTVTVTNGLLTVSNATGAKNNKIDFIDIVPVTSSGGLNFANGFTGATGLTLNGSAAVAGSKLRLTDGNPNEAGSVFSTSKVGVSQFSTQFDFQITNPDADGFTFTIQGVNPTQRGGPGGGLGYGDTDGTGATIPQSVAIKFDLYGNAGEGDNSTGLYVNGAAPTQAGSVNLAGSGIDLHSGHVFRVNMTYDGTRLTVIITDLTTNASATQTYLVNIPGIVGGNTAFVGFTGGTGGLTATQDILNWTYSPR